MNRLLCIQGKAGYVPTAEELAAALKSHDLFLYFGHGSGMFIGFSMYLFVHSFSSNLNCKLLGSKDYRVYNN